MTGNHLMAFLLFCGIWLLVPILVDGSSTFTQLTGVWLAEWRKKRKGWRDIKLKTFPRVSLIVPVYNGAHNLGKTIQSIRAQSYPLKQLEVIVADNGSDDATRKAFLEQQWHNSIGSLQWISIPTRGKAWALNAGIHMANGEYIGNVDCDVELHPDAVLNMVKAFEADTSMGAATAAIEITASNGEKKSPFRYLMQECEFFEYLAAFWVGRQYQTVVNSLYTLAGAFSLFRRRILLNLTQYSNRTVTEDTDITFSQRAVPADGSGLRSRRHRVRGARRVPGCPLLTASPVAARRAGGGRVSPSPPGAPLLEHERPFPREDHPGGSHPGFPEGGVDLPLADVLPVRLCPAAGGVSHTGYVSLLHGHGRYDHGHVLPLGSPRGPTTTGASLVAIRGDSGLPVPAVLVPVRGFVTVLNEPPQWQTQPPWSKAVGHGKWLASTALISVSSMASYLTRSSMVFLTGFFARK